MKKKRFSLLFIFCLFLCAGIGGAFLYQKYSHTLLFSFQPADFTETNAKLSNPYQGWYQIHGYLLSDTSSINEATLRRDILASKDDRLTLLEINLRNYSDGEIDEAGLEQLEQIFSLWETSQCALIVRFLYDWNNHAIDFEPSDIGIIKQHMQQTASIVNLHKTSIYLLQGIFVGDCGEMHSSNYMENDSMCELAGYLASVIDPAIFLSVRTPSQYRSITRSFEPVAAEAAFSSDLAARIGLFNDGMLGSETDLGTYGDTPLSELSSPDKKANRQDELLFQNELCHYVPNGGEVVLDNSFNDLENAVSDLASMHVSYLNRLHDETVLNKWKNRIWNSDDCFQGMDGYSYIGRHLGYRYRLLEASAVLPSRTDTKASLTFSIENSGFSNCYRPFTAVLALQNEQTKELTLLDSPASANPQFCQSGQTLKTTVSLDVHSLEPGSYRLFYQLADSSTGEQILLANTQTPSKQGYLLGTFSLEKPELLEFSSWLYQ